MLSIIVYKRRYPFFYFERSISMFGTKPFKCLHPACSLLPVCSEERTSELWLEQLHLRSGLLQFMNFLKTCINKSCPCLWKTGPIVTGNSSKGASAPHCVTTHTHHRVCISVLLSCLRWGEVICRLKHQVWRQGWWLEDSFWNVFHDRLLITCLNMCQLFNFCKFTSQTRK